MRTTTKVMGVLLAFLLVLLTVPVSYAAVVISGQAASVNGNAITVNFTVSGTPEGGMEATILAVKKTATTGAAPSVKAGTDSDVIYINQKTVTNGANSFSFPVGSSLGDTVLRVYIGGNQAANTVFVDITPPMRGDANCDNTINAADAAAILRHIVKLTTLSEQGLKNAKVTAGDGAVTAADAAKILRWIVRLEIAL